MWPIFQLHAKVRRKYDRIKPWLCLFAKNPVIQDPSPKCNGKNRYDGESHIISPKTIEASLIEEDFRRMTAKKTGKTC